MRSLTCRKIGHILLIQVDEPSKDDAWLDRVANELTDACQEINWDDEIRVVVLSYPGNAFHPVYDEQERRGGLDHLFRLPDLVAQIRKPVIAALHGDTDGFGMELALACDLRIGMEGASYGMTQVERGFMPMAGGTQRLPRLIGLSRALDMILTGEKADATAALSMRLIDRVAVSDQLLETAVMMAKGMAFGSPLAMRYAKEAVYGALDHPLAQGMRMEMDLYLLLFASRDRVEGITAFRELRPPKFKGE